MKKEKSFDEKYKFTHVNITDGITYFFFALLIFIVGFLNYNIGKSNGIRETEKIYSESAHKSPEKKCINGRVWEKDRSGDFYVSYSQDLQRTIQKCVEVKK